jgi:hypothetical protein
MRGSVRKSHRKEVSGHQTQSHQYQTLRLSKDYIKDQIKIGDLVRMAVQNKKSGQKKEGIFGKTI